MQRRIVLFDELRGFTMISMALFHASYDLAYIYGVSMPWFVQGMFQDIWRASISWVFLWLAGWMCSCSHDNLRRSVKYALAALLVWVATTIASVDDSVNFGIIFCMAASTFLAAITMPLLRKMPPGISILVCLLLFALFWPVPKSTYDISGLAWLGLPGPGFVSGDYYPLVPFFFMYLVGYFSSRFVISHHALPEWIYKEHIAPLACLGRHALPFYLLHQPIILIVLEMFYSVL